MYHLTEALLLGLSIVNLSHATYIDESCNQYSFVAESIPWVFRIARQASDALNDPVDQRISDLAGWLFGAQSNWAEAKTRMSKVANIPEQQSGNLQNPGEWLVQCSSIRFVPLAPPVPDVYWDPRRRVRSAFPDVAYDQCFNADGIPVPERSKAYTINYPTELGMAVDTGICPWYLDYVQNNQYLGASRSSIDESLYCSMMSPNIVIEEHKKTMMDVRATFEFSLAHELQHHEVVGTRQSQLTPPLPETYHWGPCVQLKNPQNAESIAFFMLGVDLILNCNAQIFENGMVLPHGVTMEQWQQTYQGPNPAPNPKLRIRGESWAGGPWSAYKTPRNISASIGE